MNSHQKVAIITGASQDAVPLEPAPLMTPDIRPLTPVIRGHPRDGAHANATPWNQEGRRGPGSAKWWARGVQ